MNGNKNAGLLRGCKWSISESEEGSYVCSFANSLNYICTISFTFLYMYHTSKLSNKTGEWTFILVLFFFWIYFLIFVEKESSFPFSNISQIPQHPFLNSLFFSPMTWKATQGMFMIFITLPFFTVMSNTVCGEKFHVVTRVNLHHHVEFFCLESYC